jgi:conjugal transfer pilus assembly protein TraL
MQENLKYHVPRALDAPMKIFVWDFDVVMIFIVIYGLGLAMGAAIVPGIIGAFLAGAYSKIKSGRQQGYSIHLLYWHMPFSIGNKRTPPSCARNFVG